MNLDALTLILVECNIKQSVAKQIRIANIHVVVWICLLIICTLLWFSPQTTETNTQITENETNRLFDVLRSMPVSESSFEMFAGRLL